MKPKLLLLAGAIAAATITVNAQNRQNAEMMPENCRCEESFEWLRPTFETNDAGFGYMVGRKGQAAYELHNQMMLEKIRAAESPSECTELLIEWLGFFRKGHIGLQLLFSGSSASQPTASQPEVWKGDITAFEKQIAARHDVEDYEGVWEIWTKSYKMGLKAEGDGYIGFIIETDEEGWEPGQVRMKIIRNGNEWRTTYYSMARDAYESGKPELIENRILRLGTGQTLKRISPSLPSDPDKESYIKYLTTEDPYFEELNPSTLYLRIPSFDSYYESAIDSVIFDNYDKLLSTENLIIDVRGNGGGSDLSFYEPVSLLYTGPIRSMSAAILSTPLNIENMREWRSAEFVEEMENKPGEFIPLFDRDVYYNIRDTVNEFPKRVGIIIDGDCGSTTEEFLIAAKQSWKVKLFGISTFGALDASNMLSVDSPDRRYRLHYTSSLSARIPGMEIDGIGLQPDFYIDKSIPDYKWVEFVTDVLNE